jgi:uncharacterized protein
MGICESVLPRLPNLRAMVFEIFPSFVPLVGLDLVRAQVERLHALWRHRTDEPPAGRPRAVHVRVETADGDRTLPPQAWERALGELVIGRAPADAVAEDLAGDPGVRIVEGLIHEFRASMIVGLLRLTSRLLMLALGPRAFRVILADHWRTTPPQMYASLEAEAFAEHLARLDLGVPYLADVLAFERAVTATLADDRTRVATFGVEPMPLLRALAAGRLPEQPLPRGHYEIELTADGPTGTAGVDAAALESAFPFH